ncbi:DNA-processing protein DprA [Pararhodobacter sp. SW119]|uniref:DNA-processing protein DprA n=1 Tax=Pararhodobacter sp. SW119 TaxID=2780075 RepID=UPI001AE0158E|nr:DNA-processing protein DprA [Pararhodobacter sp. SW119]
MLSSPTPFTPPTTEEDRLDWLRLIRSRRVGPSTFQRLIAEHGTAAAALDALPGIAGAAGIDSYTPCPRDTVLRERDAAARAGAVMLCLGAPDYPPALAGIPDAPPVLWAVGRRELGQRPAVALVGARNASSLGQRMARKLAEGLGEHGFVLVSGLARGVDAVAHTATLTTGTIAVLAGGVDILYPTENAPLGTDIGHQGLRISEQPMGLQPQARHFPRRNRLISGLSRAVVVVEAAEGSGSLITARDALDQGREVLAVPGHPLDARAAGCNALIRDGARLIRDVADILEALETPLQLQLESPAVSPPAHRAPPPAAAPRPARAPDALGLHRQILDRLGPSPLAEDQLIRDLALPAATLAPAILFLELDGRIERQPGGLLARI